MNKPLRSYLSAAALGFLLLAACGPKPSPAASPAVNTPTPDNSRAAIVSEIANDVEAKASEAESFAQAGNGTVVNAGGQVRTGDASKARLDFSGGSIIRLAANSTFSVQQVETANGGLLARLKLEVGKIWVSLSGGAVEVETPVGVASVRGSFAIIAYDPGDPNDPSDDVLILDCLEGECGFKNDSVDEELGNLEGLVLTGGTQIEHIILTGTDVENFLNDNPEGQKIKATLTAAAPAVAETPTETQAPPTPTDTATLTPLPTDTSTSAPTDTSTPTRVRPRSTSTGTPTPTGTITLTPTATCPPGDFYDPFQQRCRPPDTPVPQGTNTPTPVPPTFTPTPVPSTFTPTFTFTPTPGLPVISGLSPGTAQAGGPGFNLTVNGSNFAPGSVVQWNGGSRTTTFVGPTQLTAAIPAADIAAVITATITVFTPPPGGGTSNAAAFAVVDTTGPTVTNLTVSPASIGATTTCTVNFTADITDPSGVSGAFVDWLAFDQASMQFNSGSVPMTQISGTTWGGSLVVDMTFAPSSPYYGTVNWSVTAIDTLSQMSNVASVTTIDVPLFLGGCP
ncbi:MAG: cell surface receptor IPT/TIG domain protein [Anaerolineales bacterium]|nr:cell surface receptor IPT/TIG domain protein [Anaerolineales bacterium]